MNRFLLILALVFAAVFGARGEAYVGVGGAVTLPQGGSKLHHVGGGALRAGWYASDFFAIEGEGAWLEDVGAIGVGGVWHWQGGELYNRFFGYSRFDPFFTFGARGWIGDGVGQVGPKAGLGAFYHLTDSWSLRVDADAVLGLDSRVEMLYTISVGVQYAF